ncbi:gliding motility-associated lipoprotein GldK [Pollutimonas subterranea]|uniref:Gliding motility-associated lipoprotein GldK n=1 Tax=Pollutimonas subterranea TaxID=2045210 RepID=A0A2N4U252_9BURK|nr:formylglycine-generating enzyme family protein [Pollutimonas subterranea]PLC49083.1 gliding motility-associated lipoprotein GldK [Pollutimonas subterranea]
MIDSKSYGESARPDTDTGLMGDSSDMVFIKGGSYLMGSDLHYIEEAPAHQVTVGDFWIGRTLVTNRQFMAFVQETGYTTVAEQSPNPADYPGALPHMLRPGSLVFAPPLCIDGLENASQWWRYEFGADWQHPRGPMSSIKDQLDHPVVHVAYADAMAYALWVGKDLPTEAEWEFAARGGLEGADFAWGDALMPGKQHMANIWQGCFPLENRLEDGYYRTSPVDAFPENGYGLFDMIGNVWEWTSDYWTRHHPEPAKKSCCIPSNPRAMDVQASYDPSEPTIRIARRVLKGGSHLCAPNYCRRYRPAARHPEPEDTSTSHVGFRCVNRSGTLA